MEILQHTEHQVSALNDLVRINNDRITGYKKWIVVTVDYDLEELFMQFIDQGKQNISALNAYIRRLGGKPSDGKSLSGKFYHAWMDMRSAFTVLDREAILDYCEYCEDVAKSAYRKALEDQEVTEDQLMTMLLTREFEDLKRSYQTVKRLRDGLVN